MKRWTTSKSNILFNTHLSCISEALILIVFLCITMKHFTSCQVSHSLARLKIQIIMIEHIG